MPFPSTNLSKLPMLGTNPFPAKSAPTIGLPVTPDPAVPSSTLDAEAAPKTDWWSIAMKVGAPLVGGLVGGKSGLRAGTQFATGVREQEAENTKLAQLEAEKKTKRDEIEQRRAELKQKQEEIAAEKKADAERKRLAAEESTKQKKIAALDHEAELAKNGGRYEEYAKLTDEASALRGVEGTRGTDLAKAAKAEDEAKKENEKVTKDRQAQSDRMRQMQGKLLSIRLDETVGGGKLADQLRFVLQAKATSRQNLANAQAGGDMAGTQDAMDALALAEQKERAIRAKMQELGQEPPARKSEGNQRERAEGSAPPTPVPTDTASVVRELKALQDKFTKTKTLSAQELARVAELRKKIGR